MNFTTIAASYTVLANAAPNPTWTSSTYNSQYLFYYDLSAVTALNNANNVYFRLTDASTTSANGDPAGPIVSAPSSKVSAIASP